MNPNHRFAIAIVLTFLGIIISIFGVFSRDRDLSTSVATSIVSVVSAGLLDFVALRLLYANRSDRPIRRCPPANAETILHLLLPPEDCDDQVNALDEIYFKKKARIGERADIWYWKTVLGLVWHQLFRGRAKSAIVKLVCWFLRLCGLANVAELLAKAAHEIASVPPPSRRRKGAK